MLQSKSIVTSVKIPLIISGFTGGKSGQQKRDCFHPGVSSLSRECIHFQEKEPIKSKNMIRAMLRYIWPEVNYLKYLYFNFLTIFFISFYNYNK